MGYAYQKMDVLIHRKDVDILSTMRYSYYDDNFQFKYENGLNLAIGFSGYNNEREWELDPAYGKIVFKSNTWGYDAQGEIFLEKKEISSHLCSAEELGLAEGGKNSKFFQT